MGSDLQGHQCSCVSQRVNEVVYWQVTVKQWHQAVIPLKLKPVLEGIQCVAVLSLLDQPILSQETSTNWSGLIHVTLIKPIQI